jgi:hypothetical protein
MEHESIKNISANLQTLFENKTSLSKKNAFHNLITSEKTDTIIAQQDARVPRNQTIISCRIFCLYLNQITSHGTTI